MNQEESGQDEDDRMKKGADSTGKVMNRDQISQVQKTLADTATEVWIASQKLANFFGWLQLGKRQLVANDNG